MFIEKQVQEAGLWIVYWKEGKVLISKGPYYESATVLHLTFFLHLTGIGKRKNP